MTSAPSAVKPARRTFGSVFKDRAFAPAMTLSLTVLLTVIALGLLTLSSVRLRSSSGATDLARVRADSPLVCGELPLVCGEPLFARDEPLLVSDDSLLVRDEPLFVREEPLLVRDESLLVRDEPLLVREE